MVPFNSLINEYGTSPYDKLSKLFLFTIIYLTKHYNIIQQITLIPIQESLLVIDI